VYSQAEVVQVITFYRPPVALVGGIPVLDDLIRAVGLGGVRRTKLVGPFVYRGGNIWVAPMDPAGADSEADPFASALCLYENNTRLTISHSNESAINVGGSGRYQHWNNALYFSTTDGSNPNTNGRTYTFDRSLDLNEWERERLARACRRWMQHPAGAAFLARGGDLTPPPIVANLGLTNKCNLRCEICGSQKHLDNTGVRRRHMQYETFEAVADTLFPLLSVVELNSQGDPLLHPQIERILAVIESHRCDVKIQHNGTLLRDAIVDLLLRQHGTISLSLDAVGQKFDEVRRGGVWSKAISGLERLLRERDSRSLTIGVYPTLTARTIGEAMNVVRWCAEHEVDEIGFHRYVPVQGSSEQAPSEQEYAAICAQLRDWCAQSDDPLRVQFESELLSGPHAPDRRSEYADRQKVTALYDSAKLMFPMEAKRLGGDPFSSCAAPNEYVEIGLDGQIGACCRAQDVALGYATSVDSFADAWLGSNYEKLRRSLLRNATGAYPLPNCAGCVKFFAPKEAHNRCAADYSIKPARGEERLEFGLGEIVLIEGIQKEDGLGHAAVFPLGIDGEYELWEDERRLGPGRSDHGDIRSEGQGQYDVGGNSVYFSTSDGSDARRNGRTYSLRLRQPRKPGDPIAVDGIRKAEGHCFTAVLPRGLKGEYELWEDERTLGPGRADHGDIRADGRGQYDISDNVAHFSTSDGTDARHNGRTYSLRLKPPRKAGAPLIVEGIRKEDALCFAAVLPPDLEGDYELWEDERKLGPGRSDHGDIRADGHGRYDVGAGALHFSTSDGSDARHNGRTYSLRPRPSRKPGDPVVVEAIWKEEGLCYTAALPQDLEDGYDLWEDGRRLEPSQSYHSDIRAHGQGRYHVGPNSLYFSTSDGSDPRRNGRVYALRSRAGLHDHAGGQAAHRSD
jgi:MoaA/NifB/PqqE/SkfB family radical SAM enzyme